MKKHSQHIIVIALILVVLLSACGSNAPAEATSTSIPPTATETATPAPSATVTPDPCAAENIQAEVLKVHKFMREFDDASSLAASLCEKIVPDLAQAQILVLGAGEMAELAVGALRKRGATRLVVINRTLERAQDLAQRWDACAATFEELPQLLSEADILLASTGAPHTIISRDMVAEAMRRRAERPLVLIDIAVPRDIEALYQQNLPTIPAVVPPGPENPLGSHALRLSTRTILIHGTNRPFGVGRRVSHGCIRLYEDDIRRLFRIVEIGTPVAIVREPVKVGVRDGRVYVEVHDDDRVAGDLVDEAVRLLADRGVLRDVDPRKLVGAVRARRGIPVNVTAGVTAAAERDAGAAP